MDMGKNENKAVLVVSAVQAHYSFLTARFWQYSTIQYSTIQYSAIQYNTIQYNTVQYNTIQYNTIQ